MTKSDHRIDRFSDARGYAYCGVCHRGLFRQTFFAHPELDLEGPGTFIQIECHVGEPYRPETWASLLAKGLRHTPAHRP